MTQAMSTPATCILHLKKGKSLQENRDRAILEAIENTLTCFGEAFKQFVYYELSKTYRMKKHEIPSRINEFANAIEGMFGDGAKLIEMKIIQHLHTKAQGFIHTPKRDDLIFTDYVESLRQYP